MSSKKPAASSGAHGRGLFLVTAETMAAERETVNDSLAHAHRIVAQVEWEVAQQAARDRAVRMQTQSASVLAMKPQATALEKLAKAIGF